MFGKPVVHSVAYASHVRLSVLRMLMDSGWIVGKRYPTINLCNKEKLCRIPWWIHTYTRTRTSCSSRSGGRKHCLGIQCKFENLYFMNGDYDQNRLRLHMFNNIVFEIQWIPTGRNVYATRNTKYNIMLIFHWNTQQHTKLCLNCASTLTDVLTGQSHNPINLASDAAIEFISN